MEAVKCPICLGEGEVLDHKDSDAHGYHTDTHWKTCYGCNGKGWVTLQDRLEQIREKSHRELGPAWQVLADTITISDKCPACGSSRYSPTGTGCPSGSHFGTYCMV